MTTPRIEYRLINANCLNWLDKCPATHHGSYPWDTIFADPPDNIGLGYDEYDDNLHHDDYCQLLADWLYEFINISKTVWFSFNVKWIKEVSEIVDGIIRSNGLGWSIGQAETPTKARLIEDKFCVQYFTFGQHRSTDFGNNMRPMWRLRWKVAHLDPDAIRVESGRQRLGDKRGDPRGRVPGDVEKITVDSLVDAGANGVFDWPRVVGNSKQRRSWHKTQLHEKFVRQCLRMSTPAGGTVLDPFAGTGTALRVAIAEGFSCDSIELSRGYCDEIALENNLQRRSTVPPTWTMERTGEIEDLPLLGGKQDHVVKRP